MDSISGDTIINPFLANFVIDNYDGEKCDDLIEGKGKMKFLVGSEYEGDFKCCAMSGVGSYKCESFSYEGEFKQNVIEGKGKYVWVDGSEYEGEVHDGLREGSGNYIASSNSGSEAEYSGTWKEGKRHGKGILYYDKDKSSFYDGDWNMGLREGYGVLVYKSGNRYEGEWNNNKKNGDGRMFWYDRNEEYNGEWRDDLPNGFGVHMWYEDEAQIPGRMRMRNRYEGNFKNGLRDGFGIFYYADGSKYTGYWKENKKTGPGIYVYDNGRIYVEYFMENRFVVPPPYEADQRPELYLDDIFTSDDVDSELYRDKKELDNILLRTVHKFDEIYKYYSSISDANCPNYLYCVTMSKFWQFLSDCKIMDKNLSLTDINRLLKDARFHYYEILKKMVNEHPFTEEEKNELLGDFEDCDGPVHDPSRPILFHEFLELIIRIAIKKYDGHFLSDRMNNIMNNNIEPYACGERNEFFKLFNGPEIQSYIVEEDIDLSDLFLLLIEKQTHLRYEDVHSCSIFVISILREVKELNLFNDNFTFEDCILTILGYDADVTDPLTLYMELLYDEYLECLGRIVYRIKGEIKLSYYKELCELLINKNLHPIENITNELYVNVNNNENNNNNGEEISNSTPKDPSAAGNDGNNNEEKQEEKTESKAD